MCGLIGLAGPSLGIRERDLFRSLLIIDSLRGIHGTGVASIGPGNDVDWVKRAGHVYDLVDLKSFDKVIGVTGSDKKVLLGHNRHATFGAHTADNAHPFDFKSVVGMHNGTVSQGTRRDMFEFNKYDTDSEAIYSNIDHEIKLGKTWQQSITDTVGALEGAWALVMWMKSVNKLVFIRNKERPLFYAYLEERKYLMWASEAWMIPSMCARHGVKIDDKVMSTAEDTIYAWDIPIGTQGRFVDPIRQNCKGKPAYVAPAYKAWEMGGHDPLDYSRGFNGAAHSAMNQHQQRLPAPYTKPVSGHLDTKRFPNENNNKRTSFKNPYKNYRGDILTKPQFLEQIRLGDTCCYCNNHTPVWGEEVCFLRPSPVGSPQYACKQCIKDEEIMGILRALR